MLLQRLLDRVQNGGMHAPAVTKTNLRLRRVNIDVQILGIDVEKEQNSGMRSGRHGIPIGFSNGMGHDPVADHSLIDEQELRRRAASVVVGQRNESIHSKVVFPVVDGNQVLQKGLTQYLENTILESRGNICLQ